MVALIPAVITIIGWTFAIIAVAITPILAAGMIMRQLRWTGFDALEKEIPE